MNRKERKAVVTLWKLHLIDSITHMARVITSVTSTCRKREREPNSSSQNILNCFRISTPRGKIFSDINLIHSVPKEWKRTRIKQKNGKSPIYRREGSKIHHKCCKFREKVNRLRAKIPPQMVAEVTWNPRIFPWHWSPWHWPRKKATEAEGQRGPSEETGQREALSSCCPPAPTCPDTQANRARRFLRI